MFEKIKLIIILIFIICIFGCSIPIQKKSIESGVKGRMVWGDTLLKNGYVYIFTSSANDFKDTPFAICGPTREDGFFTMDLLPGKYYVIGRKKIDDTKSDRINTGDYFSYYGGNPVIIKEKNYTFVGLSSIKIDSTNISINVSAKGDVNVLEGHVVYQGLPLEEAFVYIYVDASTEFRGPGFAMAGPTKQDGYFKFTDLPENNYYIVARKRSSGEKAGPVERGDYFGYYLNNPIKSKNNTLININIDTAMKSGEIGELDEGKTKSSNMYIKGIITDEKGKSIEGIYVFAYSERVIGHKRPTYISSKSDKSGKYILYFDKPGKFYIGARQNYGDSPKPGEFYGLYDQTADHSIVIQNDTKLENINFIVQPILTK
ncbi:hypothetical protein HZA55_04325 [Candidatus Poribacteria bacterium]|nr:hypothetical protein [Candidatus Poribacteria bacterium]